MHGLVGFWGSIRLEISPTTPQGLSDPLVIDVRDPNEVAEGKGGPPNAIPGSVPLADFFLLLMGGGFGGG